MSNKKIISKLNNKTLKKNKGRTCITIISIMLTCIMLTSILTLAASVLKSSEYMTAMQVGTIHHGGFKQVDPAYVDALTNHPLIDNYGLSTIVGTLEMSEVQKRNYEVRTMDYNYFESSFLLPLKGNLPLKENEVVVDRLLLDHLKKPYELDQKVQLSIRIGNDLVTKDFKISGISNNNVHAMSGFVIVSEVLKSNYVSDTIEDNYLGAVDIGISFSNKYNIRKKLNQIVADNGVDPKKIEVGINWAYINTLSQIDFPNLVSYLLLLLILMTSGYLIIYNIYYISVTKDVQYYGLLKAIGMTNQQIKKLVYKQGLTLYLLSLPLGLFFGYLLGNKLVPYVISSTIMSNAVYSNSYYIFIFATMLTLVTVLISCKKPAKIASNTSPIEAIRLSTLESKNKPKVRTTGGKIYKMAWFNTFKSKKKVFLVILSLAFSLSIIAGVQVMVNSFDPDEMLERRIGSDYLIADAKYFSYQFEQQMLPDNLLQDLSGEVHPFYKENKVIQLSEQQQKNIVETMVTVDQTYTSTNDLLKGELGIEIFGCDDYILNKLRRYLVEGDIPDQLSRNQIIIEDSYYMAGERLKPSFQIGDFISIGSSEYEIVGKVSNLPPYLYDQSFLGGTIQAFSNSNQGDLMSIMVNGDIDRDYVESTYPMVIINSKDDYMSELNDYVMMIKVVGYSLSFILSMIGVLNFINMICTSIIVRNYEFAVLESIGMTSHQLKKMLVFEGGYVVGLSVAISLVISLLICMVKGQSFYITSYITYYSCILILSAMALSIPLFAYKYLKKESLVKRLQKFK